MVAIGEPARIIYTNYRGETAERTITPKRVWYGISDWHPEPQWFLTAFDHAKDADRDFALRDFGHIQPDAARLQTLQELSAIAEKQKAYWFEKQKWLKGLEDAYSEDGEDYTPLGDHEAWKSGSANGHYSEADWFLQTIENLLSRPELGHADAGKSVEGDDGRPCSMDEFMAALFNEKADEFDISEAAASWVHGDWKEALSYLTDVPTHWRPLPTPPTGEVA